MPNVLGLIAITCCQPSRADPWMALTPNQLQEAASAKSVAPEGPTAHPGGLVQTRLTMTGHGTAAVGARVFATTLESDTDQQLPHLIGYVTTPTTRGTDASIGATAVCSAYHFQQIFSMGGEPQDINTTEVAVQNLNSPALHTARAEPHSRLDQ